MAYTSHPSGYSGHPAVTSGSAPIAPILVEINIPTSSSNVDTLVSTSAGIEAIVFYYTTASSPTTQSESLMGAGAWTKTDSFNAYAASGFKSGEANGVRINGRSRAIGIQTSGAVAAGSYLETPDIYAVCSEISGGFRLAFTVAGSPAGLNLGGRIIAVVFPVGVDTGAKTLCAVDTTTPMTDDTSSDTLDVRADALFGYSCCSTSVALGNNPLSLGVSDFGSEFACMLFSSAGAYTCRNEDLRVLGQPDGAAVEEWSVHSFHPVSGEFENRFSSGDRIIGTFVRGYEVRVVRTTKVSGTTQAIPDFGIVPDVILGFTAGTANGSGSSGKIRWNVAAYNGTLSRTISFVAENASSRTRSAYRDVFLAMDDISAGTYNPGVTGSLSGLTSAPTLTWSGSDGTHLPELYLVAIGRKYGGSAA